MKSVINISLFLVLLAVFSSCSTTRYVPEGQSLLVRNQMVLDNKDQNIHKSDLVRMQKQTPNSRFLLILPPLKLSLYSLSNIKKDNWINRFLQRVGEEPVIFDSTYAEQTVSEIRRYLASKGHFEPDVSFTNKKISSKRNAVTYRVSTGKVYRYRNVNIDIQDQSLKPLLKDWTIPNFIKPGDPYDLDVLDNIRQSISFHLQNAGYYLFNKEHVGFKIDSNLNAHLMDITLVIQAPEQEAEEDRLTHQKFEIENVYIYPENKHIYPPNTKVDTTRYCLRESKKDTSCQTFIFIHEKPLEVSPYAVVSKLTLNPGTPYQVSNINRTYENLLDLKIYRSTNISFDILEPDFSYSGDKPMMLRTNIEMRLAPPKTWGFDVEYTNSDWQGFALNTIFSNKNLFGGAEIFNIRLRGAIDLQYLLDKEKRIQENLNIIYNFDVKLETSLEIPRFIGPVDQLWFSKNFKPKTTVSLSYNYQLRPRDYVRTIANATFGYTWRQNLISHALSPLDFNIVNINPTSDFEERIDSLSKYSQRLRYQYADHFIFAARYNFLYNEQQLGANKTFNFFRFSIETSGNLLNLYSRLFDTTTNAYGQHKIFGIPYSQYVRFDTEYKRHWFFNNHTSLVARTMFGIGIPYGNSSALPYEKGFFAGGTNNIRAWPLNRLGPGSFSDPNKLNIEQIGDIVSISNLEFRFPFYNAFKGALFIDVGNIWLKDKNPEFPNGEFSFSRFFNDLAIGGGIGLRWDLNFFVIRLDAAVPLRDPSLENGKKWVGNKIKLKDFILNFGLGYPF